MYPWIWNWAPNLHFPWSGSVAQEIDPNTSWFFNSIGSSAGNGRVEKKAFEVASYGRQLGLITEVLLESVKQQGALSAGAQRSVKRLEKIQTEIDAIKRQDVETIALEIEEKLAQLKERDNVAFMRLTNRMQYLISDSSA